MSNPATPTISTTPVTNNTHPTFGGTADAGTTVTITTDIGGTQTTIGIGVADGSGNWSIQSTATLTEGTHAVTATSDDGAGNVSTASAPASVIIDTFAPGTPTMSLTGQSITNAGTLVLRGAGDVGSTVTILDGTRTVGTTVVAVNGAWTFYTSLSEGAHSFTAVASDAAGNVSGPSAARNITVDTTPPATPTIALVGPALTNVGSVPLTGTGEVGSTITVMEGARTVGTAVVAADGTWTMATTQTDGLHALTAKARDAAGNNSGTSTPATVTVDTHAPNAPTIALVGPALTNSTSVTVGGSAEAFSTVTVKDGSTVIGTAVATAGGTWTLTTTAAAGGHSLTATATDAAANVSAVAGPALVTIDTQAPVVPTIALVGPALRNTGGVTVTGTAEANSIVGVSDGATYIGTATVDANGHWSLTTTALDGAHSLTAIGMDAAGNSSAASGPALVTIDTQAPATPTIALVGPALRNTGGVTVQGSAEALSTVTVREGATVIGTATADANGLWSLATTATDGTHALTATAADAAGNVSGSPTPAVVTIDTLAPTLPTIALVGPALRNSSAVTVGGTAEAFSTVTVMDGATVVGTATTTAAGTWTLTTTAADGAHGLTATATDAASNTSASAGPALVTIDTQAPNTPTIALIGPALRATNGVTVGGTAEAFSTVTVSDGSTVVGTAAADAAGVWTLSTTATDGTHTLTATATDAANNASTPTGPALVTIDTQAPGAPTITLVGPALRNTNGVTVTGTAEAFSTVSVKDGSQVVGTATADAAGLWTLATTATDGLHSLTATAADAAGNVSGTSGPALVTIDTLAPNAPTITHDGPALTNNAAVTLRGTGDVGSTVTVTEGGATVGTATVAPDATWSLGATLADGTHSFSASATDAAGNASPAATPTRVTVDTVAPAAPVLTSPAPANSNLATPVLSGTAEAGATITITEGPNTVTTALVDPNGHWSAAVPTLRDGVHAFAITATDAAGNVSPRTLPPAFSTDATAPVAPTLTINPPALSNNASPTFGGRAEIGTTVVLTDETSNVIGSAVTDANGDWTITATRLADGRHAMRATATDPATNASPSVMGADFVVDTTPPAVQAAPTIDGQVAGLLTNADATVHGTAEAGGTIAILEGNAVIGTATVDSSGNWSARIALSDGAHQLATTETDAAGNTSARSPTNATLVDTTPPAVVTPPVVVPPVQVILPVVPPVVTPMTPPVTTPVSQDPVAPPTTQDPVPQQPETGVATTPPTAADGTSIFRFFDSIHGTQFMTASAGERDEIMAARPDLTYEGRDMGSFAADPNDPNVAPVFRFFSLTDGTHFMTADVGERDTTLATRADLRYEGVAFNEHLKPMAGDVEVYRFFNQANGSHLYTTDAGERASIVATRQDMTDEGIAFYAPKA